MAASMMAATTAEARRGRATAFALCQGWAAVATSSRRHLVHHRKKWMVLMFDGLYRIVRRGLWHLC